MPIKTTLIRIILLLTLLLCSKTYAASLTTTFAGGNSQDGNMFDVVTFGNSLVIHSLDLAFTASSQSVTVQVYTKTGTWVGNHNNAAAWTLHSSQPGIITAAVPGTPVNVDIPDLILPANATTGFYVTILNTDPGNLRYTNGTGVGNVAAANADLQILEGAGLPYSFPLSVNTPRIWNGTIYYTAVIAASVNF